MDSIKSAIKKRYDNETCGSLGCGDTLGFANIKEGETVLDLGCGSGGDVLKAACQVGENGTVIGLDFSEEMLEKARRRISDCQYDNILFVRSDIEEIKIDDDSVDVVISNCVINHAKSKQKVYEEIYRVLKSGGRFVVSDAASVKPLPDEIKNDPEAWAECFGGAITESEYMDMLEHSRFGLTTVLKRREYVKNGYDFVSLTIMGVKYNHYSCCG